jgi:hypothetical protein
MDSGFNSRHSNISPMLCNFDFNETMLQIPNIQLNQISCPVAKQTPILDHLPTVNSASDAQYDMEASYLSKQPDSLNDFVMPFFYKWSKNSLNRIKNSFTKFIFISKIKESILNSSQNIQSVCESVEQVSIECNNKSEVSYASENKINHLNASSLVSTVKLFTISNCKMFNQYFFGIYDANFL